MMRTRKLVGFIGLGKLGKPVADVISQHHDVFGYDIEPRCNKAFEIQKSIRDTVDCANIVFVAVPTPHDPEYDGRAPTSHLEPKDFDYSIVKDVIAEANHYMGKSQMLVLISTVLPGTVRREIAELAFNTNFVYNPYLIAMGSVKEDMIKPEMVIIGTENGSDTYSDKLVEFYKTFIDEGSRYVVGTWDEAECIKIFYNTFISAKIGLVNMIQDVAEEQGNINVDVVTDALANSTQRIMGKRFMIAGMGDGGGCHPRDNIALRFMAKELNLQYDLFNVIMLAREKQAERLAQFILDFAVTYRMPVYIHGKSFKPGVEYVDGSYSLLVGHYIEEAGMKVAYIDPLTGDNCRPFVGVFLLAHSAAVTYGSENEMYCDIPDGSVVIDPWRQYKNENCTVIHYGNTRSIKDGI